MNYTLSFQQQWPPQQLVRSGGEHDPLRRELRTVTVAQYKNAMVNQGKKTPKKYDFCIDMNGDIIPELSTGFSTFTDSAFLPEPLKSKPERLWRIECGVMQMYPAEMQLKSKKEHDSCHYGINSCHYGINPTASVTPETFRRMLRCLPWVKVYSFEELRKIYDKSK